MKFRAFNLCSRRERMPSFPQGRRSRRVATKKPANLVINLSGVQKMFPCLIVDGSQEGFRLRGNFRLRRGQLIELVLDDPVDSGAVRSCMDRQSRVSGGGGSGVTNCRQMILGL